MFTTRNAKAALAGFGVSLAMLASPALAEAERAAADEAPLVLAQATSFDDETIEGFATAEMAIQEIRATYIPQLDEAQTEEERITIQQEATDAMVAAVDETDNITVDEYNSIVDAVAEDPDLAQRIEQELVDQQAQ